MKEPERLPSLEQLGHDISQLQEKVTDSKPGPRLRGSALAMRLSLELVSGVLVGAGSGVVLDRWLGTTPFLLVICLFLGAGGGFLTMCRTASLLDEDDEEEQENGTDES